MLTSSRKRINSIEVSQLISEIRETARSDSIYNKLNSYDQVIKKYKIDPLDSTALQIYEYLIEQQTLSSLPTNSRIKMQSFKFSRNHIHVLEEEEAQLTQKINDIQDPEIYNDKLFSFAKNHKNQRQNIRQDELKPKQLFDSNIMKEKSKSKSDNKVSKNPIFFVNQAYSHPLFDDGSQQLNGQNKKSVKTISYLSNSESQSSLLCKNQTFNSQKTKQIPEYQVINPKSQLALQMRHRYFNQFIGLVQLDKNKILKIQYKTKIKYFQCMRLLKHGFKGLQQNLFIERQNKRKALNFHILKSQYLVEEYFLQWKQFTVLSQQTKQRYQNIQDKSKRLTSYLFINNLKQNLTQNQKSKEKIQNEKQIVRMKSNLLLKNLFFTNFSSKFTNFQNQKAQTNQLLQFIQINRSDHFFKFMNKFLQNAKIKEFQQIQKCIRITKGRTLIEGLKNQLNFNEVYWKNKENSKKLIFLNYLLTTVKSNFQRQGYQYSWMPQIQKNINIVDSKLKNVLSHDIKIKAFKRLNFMTQSQKQKKQKIKVMLIDNFLKCLAFSSYVDCRKKADYLKSSSVQQFIQLSQGLKFIQLLDNRAQKNLYLKQRALNKYLRQQKCQSFFIYFDSYHRSKQFYSEKIVQLKQKLNLRLILEVWINFKRVLKGQIINNKLVVEYLNLKNRIIAQRCFEALKGNIFEQKLFRKKQNNLIKLIKLRSFTSFYCKLKENFVYQPSIKNETINNFTNFFPTNRKIQFFQVWKNILKEKKLKSQIEQVLINNYQSHLMTKCFNVMKFVTLKTKQQKTISQQIQANYSLKIKEICFQKLLQTLVNRKSAQKIIEAIQNFSKIIQLQSMEQSFHMIKYCSQN